MQIGGISGIGTKLTIKNQKLLKESEDSQVYQLVKLDKFQMMMKKLNNNDQQTKSNKLGDNDKKKIVDIKVDEIIQTTEKKMSLKLVEPCKLEEGDQLKFY